MFYNKVHNYIDIVDNIQLFTKWTGRNEIITSRDGKILTAHDGNGSYLK